MVYFGNASDLSLASAGPLDVTQSSLVFRVFVMNKESCYIPCLWYSFYFLPMWLTVVKHQMWFLFCTYLNCIALLHRVDVAN
jgi:hypothetical protein